MSTRQTGNARENRCGDVLRLYNYEPFYSRGSRGVDILAVQTEANGQPHLLIAVIRPIGGNIREAFQKLRDGPRIMGSRHVVAKEIQRNRWRWFSSEDDKTESFDELLTNIAW